MALNREENNDKNKQTTKTNNKNKKQQQQQKTRCYMVPCLPISSWGNDRNVKILLFLSEIEDDGTVGGGKKKKKKTKSHITDLIVAVFMSIS